MRTIKFRGKRVDNGEWIYGDLSTFGGTDCEISDWNTVDYSRYDVEPATVGQLTGLFDKNGKEIYEGDGIKTIFSYTEWCGYVTFLNGNFVLVDSDKNGQYLTLQALSDAEVIGNIHDNPELLKTK